MASIQEEDNAHAADPILGDISDPSSLAFKVLAQMRSEFCPHILEQDVSDMVEYGAGCVELDRTYVDSLVKGMPSGHSEAAAMPSAVPSMSSM